jgi:TPP-dependent trihydroxycyclohexane-1,2-dione (THcHDO) dehydratase
MSGKTVRLTVAQALIRFLANQYIQIDGKKHKLIR